MKDNFIDILMKLEPQEVVGVARILHVSLIPASSDGKWDDGDTTRLIIDTIHAYDAAPRKRRRELIKIMKEAIKK